MREYEIRVTIKPTFPGGGPDLETRRVFDDKFSLYPGAMEPVRWQGHDYQHVVNADRAQQARSELFRVLFDQIRAGILGYMRENLDEVRDAKKERRKLWVGRVKMATDPYSYNVLMEEQMEDDRRGPLVAAAARAISDVLQGDGDTLEALIDMVSDVTGKDYHHA